jgi:thioredoxin-related protein
MHLHKFLFRLGTFISRHFNRNGSLLATNTCPSVCKSPPLLQTKNLRYFLLLPIYLSFPFYLICQTYAQDFNQAKEEALQKEKPILMIFSGSDWCKPCIQFEKEVLSSEKFAEFSENSLILLKLDFPYSKKNQLSAEKRKHNEALADIYNPDGIFPLVLLVNAEGKLIRQIRYKTGQKPNDIINQITTKTNRNDSDQ